MEYNITYREKDKGIQVIISKKQSDGKWKQIKSKQGFKLKREAKRWAEDEIELLEEKEELNSKLDEETRGMLLEEFFKMFIETKSLTGEGNTIITYEKAMKAFSTLSHKAMQDITSVEIQKIINQMVKKNKSYSTITLYVSFMKTIFNSAISPYRIIVENPFASNFQLPTRDKHAKKIKALTKAQLNDILDKFKNAKGYKAETDYLICLIAGTMGLRLGEIVGLCPRTDIDKKKSIAKIDKQWKMLKTKQYGLGKTKSPNSVRSVPIPPNTLQEILRYEEKQKMTDIHGRLFARETNTKNISTRISRKLSNLGYDISVHDLRHTYATLIVAQLDIVAAAAILGDTPQMIMTTYLHTTEDTVDRASKVVGNIF